jgi:LAS superfamily LD-carboxypeptidase LdcB
MVAVFKQTMRKRIITARATLNSMKHTRAKLQHYLFPALCIVLALYGIYATYRYISASRSNRELAATVNTLRTSIQELEGNLSLTEYERDRLTYILDETQQDASELANQTQTLAGKVDELEKLQTLDPELLKKYSKVYFLNEHYVPSSLVSIDSKFTSPTTKAMQFHGDAWPYLQSLLEDADAEGLGLRVASAYRSFGAQESLKARNVVLYGSGANRFSADQGYSEHQLGTTVDFTTIKTGNLSNSFDTTPEYRWLLENAHRYGFTLSYPKGNKYYIYEPWHWRFVGVVLATELHRDEKHLYDLDQRFIDQYLLNLFD